MLRGKEISFVIFLFHRCLKNNQEPAETSKQPQLNLHPTATEITSPAENHIHFPFTCSFWSAKTLSLTKLIVQPISCWEHFITQIAASLQTKWCGCEGLKINLATNIMFFNTPFMAGCSMDPRGNNVAFCVACVSPPSPSHTDRSQELAKIPP